MQAPQKQRNKETTSLPPAAHAGQSGAPDVNPQKYLKQGELSLDLIKNHNVNQRNKHNSPLSIRNSPGNT